MILATAIGFLAGVLLTAVVARRRQSASATRPAEAHFALRPRSASHGGRMWATNNSHAGATFHVVLPYAPAEREL